MVRRLGTFIPRHLSNLNSSRERIRHRITSAVKPTRRTPKSDGRRSNNARQYVPGREIKSPVKIGSIVKKPVLSLQELRPGVRHVESWSNVEIPISSGAKAKPKKNLKNNLRRYFEQKHLARINEASTSGDSSNYLPESSGTTTSSTSSVTGNILVNYARFLYQLLISLDIGSWH